MRWCAATLPCSEGLFEDGCQDLNVPLADNSNCEVGTQLPATLQAVAQERSDDLFHDLINLSRMAAIVIGQREKTFAQLLPERFDDPDFRKDFNEIVVQEIDRLDKIITQINNFAHPSELVLKPIDVRASVRKAIVLARERVKKNGVAIDTMLPNDLPRVLGDEAALTEAFAHLVTNAAEATSGQMKPRIILAAKKIREGGHASGVVVTVKDNGKGISAELKEKVFSPFCTTKARGMGLGLPIVKRTIFDHNGRVDIDSSSHGTSVSVMLPASPNGH